MIGYWKSAVDQGVNFGTIREAIGERGSLIAIDYSPEMIEKAEERVENHGWENIKVFRADATTADLDGPYDAAITTLALSVMPDVERAVRNVHSALKPGASLGVLEIQEFQTGPLRVFNPLLKRFLRWYANWNPNENVRLVIDDVFEEVEPLDTFMLGTVHTMIASRTTP
ncbi:class I SAM-dependent methyltransferase [Haloprofundus salinisoli]|uniref:class I SAM-dependent methyltransferase n=1 Tax=Haloprofundus salinisoli TaxID=2876193 RepID=UPI001CCC9473|nr:class I SAM-dependent methyltransferase [Haloprofundus salinisoli]